MIFSFGKNASTSVFKTANHLKDVIEKKVIYIHFFTVKNTILRKIKKRKIRTTGVERNDTIRFIYVYLHKKGLFSLSI